MTTRPLAECPIVLGLCVLPLFTASCVPPTQPPPDGEATWQLALQGLPAALLSISGTSATDIYAVGADPGDGPYLLNYDGSAWRRLDTGAGGDLWWITDSTIGGDFYLGGENGLILRFDPAAESFETQTTPGDQLIFGVWGSDADNVWAVGGDADDLEGDTGGVIWRFDGDTWTVEDLSLIAPNGVPPLFKVWGRSATEVYVCGFNGVILRYDGTNWLRLNTDTSRRLFTIHGNDAAIIAVGGFGNGVIEEFDGFDFEDAADNTTPQLNGVFVPASGSAVAVGNSVAVLLRGSDGAWIQQPTGLRSARDFHACWVDPDGGIWAVGGNVVSDPLNEGVLAYRGTRTLPTTVE